jgi:transposase
LLLTPGNTGDVTVAPALIEAAGPFSRLLADKAYDANWLRELIAEQGAEAVIPCNPTRKKLIPYDAAAYCQRNLIERMFCRLKDFRRIATRYDKLARNFFSATLIAAIVIWWIN